MKKVLALALALIMVCFAFAGCEKYSDTEPMKEEKVEEFLKDKKESAQKDVESWSGYEVSINQNIEINGETSDMIGLVRYNNESKNIYLEMTMKGMSIKAYVKDGTLYCDSFSMDILGTQISMNKKKFSAKDMGMEDLYDIDQYLGDEGASMFTAIEKFDAKKFEELGVKVYVTKNDEKGETFRLELSQKYFDYIAEEIPEAASTFFSELGADINIKDTTVGKYEIKYAFDKNDKLSGVSISADLTVDSVKTVVTSEMKAYNESITFNESDYEDYSLFQ